MIPSLWIESMVLLLLLLLCGQPVLSVWADVSVWAENHFYKLWKIFQEVWCAVASDRSKTDLFFIFLSSCLCSRRSKLLWGWTTVEPNGWSQGYIVYLMYSVNDKVVIGLVAVNVTNLKRCCLYRDASDMKCSGHPWNFSLLCIDEEAIPLSSALFHQHQFVVSQSRHSKTGLFVPAGVWQ